jgi:hypothetical protein
MPLREDDIKSELSYAYLHAVVSRAGCECQESRRHSDGLGIDARLFVNGKVEWSSPLSRFTVEIQLKATSTPLAAGKEGLAFRLSLEHYDKLRVTDTERPLLLVVLQLPERPEDWLKCSPQALTLKRCAHWVSLYGAPPSANDSYQTVYLPRANRFTAEALRDILATFARRERISYVSG